MALRECKRWAHHLKKEKKNTSFSNQTAKESIVQKGLHFNRTSFIIFFFKQKKCLKANTGMYQGVDVTWYLQRSCCVINENSMLGEK